MESISERVQLALQAGYDELVVCNRRKDAIISLENLERSSKLSKLYMDKRLQKLFPRRKLTPLHYDTLISGAMQSIY